MRDADSVKHGSDATWQASANARQMRWAKGCKELMMAKWEEEK